MSSTGEPVLAQVVGHSEHGDASPYNGTPLNASCAEFFRLMLQFPCLQMYVYGGSAVPKGGWGDRHLATVPQGVVGDRLPSDGAGQGGGGDTIGDSPN